jgi:hypothetical protein
MVPISTKLPNWSNNTSLVKYEYLHLVILTTVLRLNTTGNNMKMVGIVVIHLKMQDSTNKQKKNLVQQIFSCLEWYLLSPVGPNSIGIRSCSQLHLIFCRILFASLWSCSANTHFRRVKKIMGSFSFFFNIFLVNK